MSIETNTTSSLGDHSTGLECVVDTLDAVILHVDEEAGRQLSCGVPALNRVGEACVKYFWDMRLYVSIAFSMILTVDANGHTHDHVLWAFGNLAILRRR